MTVLATRGAAKLVDDGDGQGHVENGKIVGPTVPVEVILKWGYWKPADLTAAVWREELHPRDEGGKFAEVAEIADWEEVWERQQTEKTEIEQMWASEPELENDFYNDYWRLWADNQFVNGGHSTISDDWQKGWTWGDDAMDVDEVIYSSEPLRDDIAVWRGAYNQTSEPSSRPISTSFDKNSALSYADRTGRDLETHLHKVLVPAGSHVGWHANESEIVLPTGTVLERVGSNLWIARVPPEKVEGLRASAGPIPGEGPLIKLYEKLLERNAQKIAKRYESFTAASLDRVLDEDDLTARQKRMLKEAREKIAREAAFAQAVQFGISFTVTNPYLTDLVEAHAGKQAEMLFAGSREIVQRVIKESLDEGWSVPQTATAIREKLLEAKKWQATMLARTDLIGLSNGGSWAAAMSLGEQRPVYKRWINAHDEKVRPTHVAAMNQVVPIDQPFEVGEASLLYPGDPHGPDDEIINCRCTLIYANEPDGFTDHLWAETAAGWDESEHPRDPGGEDGGEFIPKGTSAAGGIEEAPGDTLDEMMDAMGAFDLEGGRERHPERYMVHPKSGSNVANPDVTYEQALPPELDPDGWGRKPPRVADVRESGFTPPAEGATPLGFGKWLVSEPRPPKYLYRAISEAEWQQALERGFIQSDQRMNLTETEGTVTALSNPSYYLPGALASDKPGTYESRIIRIKYRDEDGWRHDRDDYVKTSKPVPVTQVDMVTPKLKREVTQGEKRWNDIGNVVRASGWGAAGWDESEHPRHPEGTSEGGKFAPKPGTPHYESIRAMDPQEMAELMGEQDRARNGVVAQVADARKYEDAARIKQLTAERLAKRLKDDPEWHAEEFDYWLDPDGILPVHSDDLDERATSRAVTQWAKSSSDHNVPSLLFQQAVADEFDLDFDVDKVIASDQMGSESESKLTKQYFEQAKARPEIYGSMRAFVRAQYAETKYWYGGKGDVLVFRGMKFGTYGAAGDFTSSSPFPEGFSTTDFDMNPASSWSVDFNAARSFTNPYGGSVILAARVPVSRILSLPGTGVGCLGESEVVLIGAGHGKDSAIVSSYTDTRGARGEVRLGPLSADDYLLWYRDPPTFPRS